MEKNITISLNLFAKKFKKNDRQPDFQVIAEVDGIKHYPVSAWKKMDKNGEPYFSLSVDIPEFVKVAQSKGIILRLEGESVERVNLETGEVVINPDDINF